MAMRLVQAFRNEETLQLEVEKMNTLAIQGLEELDDSSAGRISGGNPVALGVAYAAAFAAGIKFGYYVVGPWLEDHGYL
jgi:hypothetical protein